MLTVPLARVTRLLPKIRGAGALVAPLRSLYDSRLRRIRDFDGDLKLDVNASDTIGFALWQIPHLFERHERTVFCAKVFPGCNVLDVGANIGMYTLLAAKRGAKVYAIEADPQNAAMLKHHIHINGFTSAVEVIEVAASDQEGSVAIRRNPRNCGGSVMIAGNDIPARTIDSLNLPPIEICKMDIEGSEEAAVRGMRDTLRRSTSLKLLIEYNPLSNQPALLSLLRQHFAHMAVAGRDPLRGDPPPDCNLWCWNH